MKNHEFHFLIIINVISLESPDQIDASRCPLEEQSGQFIHELYDRKYMRNMKNENLIILCLFGCHELYDKLIESS